MKVVISIFSSFSLILQNGFILGFSSFFASHVSLIQLRMTSIDEKVVKELKITQNSKSIQSKMCSIAVFSII